MICVLVGTHSCGGKCNIFKSLYVWSESPSIHRHDVVVLLSADTVYVYIFHLSLFFSQRMFVGETLAIFRIYIYTYTHCMYSFTSRVKVGVWWYTGTSIIVSLHLLQSLYIGT